MPRMTLPAFKQMVREQHYMLLIDPEAALAAIPDMLPSNMEDRRRGLAILLQVLKARGEIAGEAAQRLARVTQLFGLKPESGAPATVSPLPVGAKAASKKAS